MRVKRVGQVVVGSVLIAIGGLWALFFAVLLLWIWGEPNVGGYLFVFVMLGVGVACVIFGSVLCRRALDGAPTAVGSGASDASSAVKVGQVALIASGGLWALLSLNAFAIYDGDTTALTFAYFLGSAALGFAVAFLGGLLGRRASSRS